MYYVYMLKSQLSNKVYIGYTNNLERRIKEHMDGCNYTTKRFSPVELVYYEAYKSEEDAKNRERQLKQYGAAYGHLKKRLKWSLLNIDGKVERSLKSAG